MAAAFFVHILSSPAQGHITTPDKNLKLTSKRPTQRPAPSFGSDSPYYSLSLPGRYKLQSAGQTMPGLLYVQTLVATSGFGSQAISISLTQIPDGGLAAVPAYQLRTQPGGHYTASHRDINGQNLELFNDTESAAVVAFWPHNGMLAVISASNAIQDSTSDGNKAQLDALLPVLTGWQWR